MDDVRIGGEDDLLPHLEDEGMIVMAGNTLYERFKSGETLYVQSQSGKRFYAKPEHWEGILLGYSILDEEKRPVKEHTRKMKDQADLRQWLSELEEVEVE